MKLEDFIKKHGNGSVDEDVLKEMLGIKDEKYFIPDVGEGYFVVNLLGEVHEAFSHSNLFTERLKYNEVFRTKEEAQEHARKQRFLLQMKRDFLDNSDEIDWEAISQDKYNITYNNYTEEIDVDSWVQINFGTPVTTNKSWLKEYIEKYEEEIKKYYFEIKEEN